MLSASPVDAGIADDDSLDVDRVLVQIAGIIEAENETVLSCRHHYHESSAFNVDQVASRGQRKRSSEGSPDRGVKPSL